MSINERIVATIRTTVPALVGLVIARVVAQVPAVADWLGWLSGQLGTPAEGVLTAVATAAIIGAYYWTARKLGSRWPWLEKWLLGSSLVPVYGGLTLTEQEADRQARISRETNDDEPKHRA